MGSVAPLSATGTNDLAPAAPARGKAGGLLIVNADDWGGFRSGTDAIEACFQAGAITSSTAMMYMSDSRRAAELAQERARPIGLHLNLTQPFDAPDVPAAVRERQRRLCLHFAPLARRRWVASPFPSVHALVADAIRDQLEQFQRQYGRQPTHLDSHHHVHVCPDVFASGALARGMRVRQTVSVLPGKRDPATALRRFKHVLLASRFLTTERFWAVREVAREGAGIPIGDAARMALTQSVEVMVHPSFPGEVDVLRSQAWAQAIAGAPLGSYARLSS
ncbi:MAG TPA: ChbG/HpnK family deacetylase [Solirubrobacteraceae bacterium]|nr:ChbG/HpnK family deacetylase [Solirubrobacteraceae bacterium]